MATARVFIDMHKDAVRPALSGADIYADDDATGAVNSKLNWASMPPHIRAGWATRSGGTVQGFLTAGVVDKSQPLGGFSIDIMEQKDGSQKLWATAGTVDGTAGLLFSSNGGTTWTSLGSGFGSAGTLGQSADGQTIVLIASGINGKVSFDGGVSFSTIGSSAVSGQAQLSRGGVFVWSPMNWMIFARSAAQAWETTDGGASFTTLATPLWGATNRYQQLSDTEGFVVGGGTIYRTTDAGQSWVNVSGDLPINSIFDLRINSAGWFVPVNDDGIYRSTNQGVSWTAIIDFSAIPGAEPAFTKVFSIDESGMGCVILSNNGGTTKDDLLIFDDFGANVDIIPYGNSVWDGTDHRIIPFNGKFLASTRGTDKIKEITIGNFTTALQVGSKNRTAYLLGNDDTQGSVLLQEANMPSKNVFAIYAFFVGSNITADATGDVYVFIPFLDGTQAQTPITRSGFAGYAVSLQLVTSGLKIKSIGRIGSFTYPASPDDTVATPYTALITFNNFIVPVSNWFSVVVLRGAGQIFVRTNAKTSTGSISINGIIQQQSHAFTTEFDDLFAGNVGAGLIGGGGTGQIGEVGFLDELNFLPA